MSPRTKVLTHVFGCLAILAPAAVVLGGPSPRNEVVESIEVLRGSEFLPPIDPEYEISVTSFGGTIAADGNFLATGSPWSEFVAIDDPLNQTIGSGVITIQMQLQEQFPVFVSISSVELESELPFDPNVCNQVWQFGRAIDIDDLGLQKDGIHCCRVVSSWLRFASSFCTQRRQVGVFLIEFRETGDPTWTLESVTDTPQSGTDFGASIAVEQDTMLVGAPGGNGYTGGGRAHLYTRSNGVFSLQQTFSPFQISDLDLGECQYDLEDHFLAYGRNDRFGNDVDISEDGAVAVIGAPGTVDEQTAQPRYVDGGGAMYVVRLDGDAPDLRMILNPDSGSLSSCSTSGSGCTPSEDHAQEDAFGTSVATTLLKKEGIYRLAGTAPGDFGLTTSIDGAGKICQADHGIAQGPCHLQAGSIVIYDLASFDGWPETGPEWSPDLRHHWKPGAERAQQNNFGFAYAFIGGHANTSSTPGFATGGSLDLEGNDVLVGGPNGMIIDPSGTIGVSPCETWALPLNSNRGTALVLNIPSNPTETVGLFRELVPADEPYPPSWRFGESVALFNGEAAVSLSWPESAQCEQGANIDCENMGSIYTFEISGTSNKPGDLNGDGEVNGSDLGLFLAAWGSQGPFADFNGDGWVNGIDLGLMLASWTS